MKRKILSFFLALTFVFSCVPWSAVTAFAIGDYIEPTIYVETKNAVPGSTVNVNLNLAENPGVAGARIKVSYSPKLTLTNVINSETFAALDYTAPPVFSSPCLFNWDSETAVVTEDGTLITLTFQVSSDAVANETLDVNVEYTYGDIYDGNLNSLDFNVVGGFVTVINYIPGDVNSDGVVNTKDVTLIRRFNAGYSVAIEKAAADVNDDGAINGKDVTLIRRFLAGYGVELKPSSPKCEHLMKAIAAKSPTCTEDGNTAYWQCTNCSKYFNDDGGTEETNINATVINATGHTAVIDPAIEPTYTTTGLSEGSHCSVCHAILKEQQIVPVLQVDEYSITYRVANNDPYLAQLNITNTNSAKYNAQQGMVLQDLMVDGYNFKGWYTAQTGGTRISELPVDSTGDKVLYAQWEKVVYTVTFDSPDVPVDSVTYTVDKGITLINPSWYGYTFVGWSNDNGFITSSIRPRTTGNITLHANWTSNRNKATSYSNYEKPTIIEDDANGQFIFVYDIGKIDNVPLSQIEYIGNTQTLNIDNIYEVTNSIASDQAKTVANAISNATTRSSGWTLSEEWNKIYSSGSEYEDTKIKTSERTDSEGNVVGGNYFVSNSNGGSSYVSTESGGSNSLSSKVTTENSKGINASYDTSKETYTDGKLGFSNSTEVSAGVSLPVKIVDVSAGIKNTTTVSGEVAAGRKDKESFHVDGQASSYVGTVDTNNSSAYYKTAANQSSTWNATSGYEKSYQTSRNTQVSEAISEQISKTTSYNLTDSLGGQNSKTESIAGTDTRKDEYSTTLKYSEGNSTTTKKHITFHSDRPGYYRLVTAGTVHVYGIVGYDVATASYYTYTFNVLDDERHEYLDYSKDNANFNDCENGVVAFEIPHEVNEYILGVTGKTTGLEFDLNSTITGFEATKDFDGTVAIPQYYSVNNGDGTYSAFKTDRFNADTFRGNENIKTVILPVYVTEIPDNAFEGCTNLEKVIAYGITKIGNNAFKGCTSLNAFSADNLITSLGSNAFENVPEVAIMAANTAVADAAINSGAKKLTLNLSKMEGSFDNKKIDISDSTDYFALISNGVAYKNLQLDSNAAETFISNIKFTNNNDTPLKLNSEKVTLSRVTVEDSPGFSLILPAENTELKLFGTILLSSSGKNAVISKNVSLIKANPEVAGTLKVTGDYLVCGEITNEKMLSFISGKVSYINAAEFEQMLTSSRVSFDANGGTVAKPEMTVYYGQKYGDMPIPTRNNYTFAGWHTAASGGARIAGDSVVTALVNQTLYAQWNPDTFKVTFDANNGNVSTSGKTLAFGDSYGTLPTPTRDYYKFIGWYTEAAGGTQITSENIPLSAKDVVLYAHWEQNDILGWVKASDMPVGAKIVSEKWTYDLTTTKTSSNKSEPGYTLYNTSSVWGAYGGWSGWSNSQYWGSDSRQVETQTVTDSAGYTQYRYWRYVNNAGTYGGTKGWNGCYNYQEIHLSYALPVTNASMGLYGPALYNGGYSGLKNIWFFGESSWIPAVTHTEYRYRDRQLVYTYYHTKTEEMESPIEVVGSDTISNIQKWVQYVAK